MHCSANVGRAGDVALFFGLSGTGKTTLSADPNRSLIGDDEHGWSPDGVFNFEGGCYAKCIKLSAEAEPEIYAASTRFGAVLENVVFDPQRGSAISTTIPRPRTPAPHIRSTSFHASHTGRGRPAEEHHLPDRGRLRGDAADRQADAGAGDVSLPVRLHRQGGGHREGPVGVEPEFSTCFGAPFLPRPRPNTATCCASYIARHKVDCWLVNTGWTGGIYGVGGACRSRRPARWYRRLDGSLKKRRATAPIPISASRCRPPCRASSRTCSIR